MPPTPNQRAIPPRIGLTTYREPAAWGVWNEPADLVPASYTDSIHAAGGAALLLPPGPAHAAAAALIGLDGLVLAGGADVEPARYGAAADPSTGAPRRDRDEWELALLTTALERDLPVLAICRGLQVLNIALGGDLTQHLPDLVGHNRHQPERGRHGRHRVRVADDGRLAGIIGPQAEVATYHHQAISRLAPTLRPVAWADDDVIEAAELPGAHFVLGVQWHPEVHDGAALFAAFLDACRQSATVRA